jgi:hypothetical protein
MSTANMLAKVCPECERLLVEATDAIRHHQTDMTEVRQSVLDGDLTGVTKQVLSIDLPASFDTAQAAWDAYREHLTVHGILTRKAA